MHQPIKEGLEEFLNGSGDREMSQDFTAHLASCKACANELSQFEDQARLLRVLRPDEDQEPRPGFYARVLDRIERQTIDSSIWSIFLRPSFGRRIAIASAALVLLMGAYLVSTEPGDRGPSSSPAAIAATSDGIVLPGDSIQQQRDAVLVNLASYQE